MPEWIPFLFIGGIVAAIVLGIVGSFLYEKRRSERLAAIAMDLGLQFNADDPFGVPTRYKTFHRLTGGHSRKAWNVMHGQMGGMSVKIFDYRYVTGSGKSSSTHKLSVVLADTDYTFEYVGIRSEGFIDRLAGMIGFSDTEVGIPEFDQAFRIDTHDPESAKRLLQPRLTDFLLQCGEGNFKVEFAGNAVLAHKDKRLKPDDLGHLVKFLLELLQQLPDSLPRKNRG